MPGPRYEALVNLLRTVDTIWNASRVFFTRWELSPSQFNVLNVLSGKSDGLSQVELGRRLLMHRSNVTGLVDRLEARGMVKRQDNPNDRRAYNVVLTSSGENVVRQILPHYYRAAEEVWGDIPKKRAEEMVTGLIAVCVNAERIAAELAKQTS